ncbi:MAG: DUF502 domain-containing protein [Woeseiaceae bacterium]|nr:DUF502 domain-containing protein [Woeseiaceae bacterium]MDX2609267.1 DUF502 domain-containing protein [Woeseiaceae bacterium]
MKFIKTTIVGGIVFMVPIIIIIVILGKAFEVMLKVARPIDKLIPIESIGGIAFVNLLALLAILVVCFGAGVLARSPLAKKIYKAIDNGLLAIPGYAFIKAHTDSMKLGQAEAKSMQPVLVQFDDNSQLGFEIERLDNGQVVIYLPGAPDPWSGSVAYFSVDRVKKLELSASEAINNVRRLGRGSQAFQKEI